MHRELCRSTCDVLHKLLETLDPIAVLEAYKNDLIAGLRHPQGAVKQLCCTQLDRLLSTEKGSDVIQQQFLEPLIDCTCDESETAGSAHRSSSHLLVRLGQSPSGARALFDLQSPTLAYMFKCFVNSSTTVWFRLMEVALECCAESKDALRLCIDNEILHQFIIKVKDDSDILSQSVAIEMLERLARTELGYDWLLGQEVMTDLVGTLDDADNPLSSFIQPAVLKFFGAVTLKYPEKVFDNNDKYFDKLFTLVHETRVDDPLLTNALDSLTATATTNQGKVVLHKTGLKINQCLKRIGSLINGGRSEVRQVALVCLSRLMQVDQDGINILSDICQMWFNAAASDLWGTLLRISTTPFSEARLAALHIFLALSDHAWAQQAMRDHPTFLEYLLDRSTESEQEGHILKYNVIRNLVHTSSAHQIFSSSTLLKLKVYEREGPLHAEVQSQVATEQG
ncbi:26S proteasome non-ATPase regulatory subunit 5-like [Watersipora subatra]|uniref:26S proteasome non-ATPase regulatory subunit 5-like n=1 Tax=Watersipora subatra TaxID=2589382 RepID=UPI00355B23D7